MLGGPVSLFRYRMRTEMTKHILTTTILLLNLFTYAAAQNRSAKETLEGLREIGVIVKYGQVDGLDAAMQPTVLQMLQDRAKDRLRQAEIPLLKSTEEAEMRGRPRLVFTITLNKRTDTAPTIVVESRLYERVRLWRDPTKEMELATWVWSGSGYASRVTHEMLFQVFEGQLDGFIRDYREVNPNPTRVISSTPNPPAQVKDNANSLQGLNGIKLFVAFRPDHLADAAQRAELQKKLQEEAESKLVQAGIPVPKYSDEPGRRPLLYVLITLGHRPNFQMHAPAIAVESAFWQEVLHLRDPQKQTYAVTWESEASDGGPITDDAVRQVLNRQLDEFIKAYSAANSKLSAVRQ